MKFNVDFICLGELELKGCSFRLSTVCPDRQFGTLKKQCISYYLSQGHLLIRCHQMIERCVKSDGYEPECPCPSTCRLGNALPWQSRKAHAIGNRLISGSYREYRKLALRSDKSIKNTIYRLWNPSCLAEQNF